MEASSRAVDLLLRVYEDLGSTPAGAAVRDWIAGRAHVIAQYLPMRRP
jgi:hypothetical protein